MPATRTVDSILAVMNKKISNREIIDSHVYVEGARMLNILIGDEYDKLFKMEQQLAKDKLLLLSKNKRSVASVEIEIEASELYLEAQKQRAKIGQVEEMIRLAKMQARFRNDELKNN